MDKIEVRCIEVYEDTMEALVEYQDGTREVISWDDLDLDNPIVYH